MNKNFVIAILVLAIVFASVLSYIIGKQNAYYSEYEVTSANLVLVNGIFSNNCPSELREYLKGRYYYLANRISPRERSFWHDYGPVSTNVDYLNCGIEM